MKAMTETVYVHVAVKSRPDTEANRGTMATPEPMPTRADPLQKNWGVVTIQVINFKPKGLRSLPPSISDSAGSEVACLFAHAFNRSEFAKNHRRWALVSREGSIVTLSSIDETDRPTDPSGFPPIVTGGLTVHESTNMADDLNRPRFEQARIPRLWSIAVRPFTAEGGLPTC